MLALLLRRLAFIKSKSPRRHPPATSSAPPHKPRVFAIVRPHMANFAFLSLGKLHRLGPDGKPERILKHNFIERLIAWES